jgi:hypothetical protein
LRKAFLQCTERLFRLLLNLTANAFGYNDARFVDPKGLNPLGIGLGLLVYDETPRTMGSTLKVHSGPGAGRQFWFTLAAGETELGEVTGGRDAQEVPPIARPSLDGLHILVVDDNPIGLNACARPLRRLGAEVLEARD